MGILAREGGGARRRVPGVVLALAALSCGPWTGPGLAEVGRLSLPAPSLSTLHVDSAGRVWLGGPKGLRIVEGSREAYRIPLEGGEAPRVIAPMAGRLYVQAGERLLAFEAATGKPLAERGEVRGIVLPDVRARFLLVAAPSGTVVGLDPLTLEALWIWPSLGEISAAALSPEGDRVHLAVSGDGAIGALLSRDLQTGRAVHSEELSARVRTLVQGPGGHLLAQGEGSLAALEPLEGRLQPLWRLPLRSLDLAEPVELRSAPGARLVAIFSPGSETGLHVLDAETGDLLGSVRGPVLDAAFAADGSRLYLLTESELRVVGSPR